MPTSQPFATSAVAYAQRGWRVFKIPPGQKVPKDRWVNGDASEVATSTPVEIARRALAFPAHNIGIATGNGLAVLDVDPRHGGKVPAWAPRTLTARTPSGGVHLYYSVAGPVRSSQGVIGPGLDVRGDGGMVLAPPSWITAHPSDVRHPDIAQDTLGVYEWANNLMPAMIDDRYLNPFNSAAAPRKSLAPPTFGEGERHAAMVSLAGTMRGRGCEVPEIQAALRALNDTRFKPPLDYQWVDKIAHDIVARYQPDDALLP